MPNFPKNHKYGKIHGHSYELIIYLKGKIEKKNEWIMDFEEIDKYVLPLLNLVDHNLLNEINGLRNPTSENIAKWFWDGLKKKINGLEKIEINRPRIGGCVYFGK